MNAKYWPWRRVNLTFNVAGPLPGMTPGAEPLLLFYESEAAASAGTVAR